jgi:hypothetical protein
VHVETIREELIRLAREDGSVREQLAADGSLFDGYNPLMALVHRRNGERLELIVDAVGWPGVHIAGEDGADAAWLLLKHAIGQPALQRRMLPLVQAAVVLGDVPAWHAATLEDGIAFYEGRPQRYGTMSDWDEHGEMRPWTIEDPDGVDERRAGVGLPPLSGQLHGMAGGSPEAPPGDPVQRLRDADEWARSVGWRD